MRRRSRTSDFGSSGAVQRLGVVRDRLPEEGGCFRVVVLFFFRWRQRQEGNERFQRRRKTARRTTSPSPTPRRKNTRKTNDRAPISPNVTGPRNADNQGSSARQFVIRDFPHKLQVEAQSLAFLTGRVVEKVHDVSPKAILEPAAFVEVERAHRIHFDLGMFAQHRAQLALESERSLPHLRHGERNNAIRHRLKSRMGDGREPALSLSKGRPSLHQNTKHSSLCQWANRDRPTTTDQRRLPLHPFRSQDI